MHEYILKASQVILTCTQGSDQSGVSESGCPPQSRECPVDCLKSCENLKIRFNMLYLKQSYKFR